MQKQEGTKRFAVVIGTRPEGIKLCPLILAMRARGLEACVISSGQHGEMLSSVFSAFGIRADIALPQMHFGEDLPALLAHLLASLKNALSSVSPAAVIVQGDTATAYTAALVGFLLHIPVIHIEAGLRSGNPFSPFPEECFRRAIAAMASVHIAPTPQAMHHLWAEGIAKERIFLLGNTVEDAVYHFLPVCCKKSNVLLLTLHRREHSEAKMRGIFSAVKALISRFPSYSLLFPVHPSPRVRQAAEAAFRDVGGVRLVAPMDLRSFYSALASAPLVLTDSGGVQEEAALLGVPTLVLRETTEREQELMEGKIHLAGTDPSRILSMATALLSAPREKKRESRFGSPSERICNVLFAFKECGFDMQQLFQ